MELRYIKNKDIKKEPWRLLLLYENYYYLDIKRIEVLAWTL